MLDHSASAVLGFSWLHRHNPLIDWVTHDIMFRPAVASSPPADAPSSANPIPCAFQELGPPTATPATAGPSSASLSPEPLRSAELRAAAARIPVTFIRASALAFLSRLPTSHPQSIVLFGIIEQESCNACAAVPVPGSSLMDDALTAEYTEL